MYLPHLLVLSATFWTSVPFATLSVFPSLICGSCPSGQRFAYSFFQIPSHGGHPCCSAMCFVVAYAHLGLSPIRKRPCWANKKQANEFFSFIILLIKPINKLISYFSLYFSNNSHYSPKPINHSQHPTAQYPIQNHRPRNRKNLTPNPKHLALRLILNRR